jgi:hypothetical protein
VSVEDESRLRTQGVRDLLMRGFSAARIAKIAGVPVAEVRKIARAWRDEPICGGRNGDLMASDDCLENLEIRAELLRLQAIARGNRR